jgi:hypothetical protein
MLGGRVVVKGVLRRRQAYIVAFLLLILVGAGALAAAPVDTVPSLFDPPIVSYQGARSAQPALRRVVTRWRPAAVRPDVLTRADGSPQVGVGQRIRLELFADASFTVTITDLVRHGPTGYTWSGTLDGIDFGSAILAVHDGATVGTVVMPGAIYRIGYAPDGTQVIEQLDESALPPEGEPVVPPPLAERDSLTAGVAADTGSQIDVMVVYTAAARAAAGGTAAMQAEVTAAVASANLAYTNNGLVQRLRLVYAGEGSIMETGDFSADLGALKNDATVASLRNAHGADLVSLFTDNGSVATFCGIGYLMTSNSTSFAPYGFSVVERDCASANLTFAHELGHNMGAHHDPYVTGGDPGLFAYSHGYVDTVARFRTVMAYNNQCVDSGFNCTRIPYFSSPNQTVNGRVIGTASASDNARTLGQSANTVANFRQAVVGGSTSTFADIPADDPFSSWVEALVAAGITSGCSSNPPLFCPTQVVTRGQMAVFLLKGLAYPGVAVPSPPSGTGLADGPASNPVAAWVEALYAASITGGCATNPLRYCPNGAATRAQMAVFLLRAEHGSGYTPPAPTVQTFADVPLGHPFASWIYGLAAEGITGGCATSPTRYCPDNQVTRAQMAVFLVRTFNLPQ